MKILNAIIDLGQKHKYKEAHLYAVANHAKNNITTGVTFNDPTVKLIFTDIATYASDSIHIYVLMKLLKHDSDAFFKHIKQLSITDTDLAFFAKNELLVALVLPYYNENSMVATPEADINYDNYAGIYGQYVSGKISQIPVAAAVNTIDKLRSLFINKR